MLSAMGQRSGKVFKKENLGGGERLGVKSHLKFLTFVSAIHLLPFAGQIDDREGPQGR